MMNDELFPDRNPPVDPIMDSPEEQSKQLTEMMDFISNMKRKQKRKIFKPTFSKSVKNAFRKPVNT